MATRQLRLEDVVQTYSSDNGSDIEHFLDDKRDLWPGFSTKQVLKSTARRRTRCPYKNSHEFLNSHENLMRFS